MVQSTGRIMTADEISFFHREGYVVLEGVIPTDELQPVIDEIGEEIDTRARALVAAGKLSRPYEEEGFETRLARISRETDKIALDIWNGFLHGPAIFHLIGNPNLVNIAEQLVGEEIIASSVYRLRPKIPNYGYGEVPWHQDSSYFEPYCDKSLVVTMWLPLVDADEENGCMWVMPGSHRSPVVRHKVSENGKYLQIEPSEFPRTGRRVACPVRKGGVLLVTNRTAHASFKNRTDQVRWRAPGSATCRNIAPSTGMSCCGDATWFGWALTGGAGAAPHCGPPTGPAGARQCGRRCDGSTVSAWPTSGPG